MEIFMNIVIGSCKDRCDLVKKEWNKKINCLFKYDFN